MEHWKLSKLIFVAAVTLINLSANASTIEALNTPPIETTSNEASEPIMAIVSIASQQVKLYDASGQILHAPVSTGTYGRETPAGIFAVVEKKKEHRSNMYDDAEMPNMHRITWNGLAMHGGPLPGYPASHGCIRLPYDFAGNLFGKTRIGMRVIISPYDTAPIEFSHPALLTPNSEAVEFAPEQAVTLEHEAELIARATKVAKKTSRSMARKVKSQKRLLYKLKKLMKRADAQLRRADNNLSAADKTWVRTGALQRKATEKVNKLAIQFQTSAAANASTQSSVEAKRVLKIVEAETASLKARLRKLEKLKKSATVQLIRANKTLSAAEKAKVRAEKRQQIAANKAIDLAAEFETALFTFKNAQTRDEAKKAIGATAHEMEFSKASLRRLESRKIKAEVQFKQADKVLSTTTEARLRAEKQHQKAANMVKELPIQINTTKAELETRVSATTSANEAFKAAKNREISLRKMESRKKKAETQLRRADKALSSAAKARWKADGRQQKAAAKAKQLALKVSAAKSNLEAKVIAAAVAKEDYKASRIRKTETAKAAYEAKLALEPVSIYISLATQKLYVRRNTHEPARDGGGEVFDSSIEVPITIRDPYMPIGTHIYTAMERNDVGLHWTVVTIDNRDSAINALDRITIPQHVLDRIEPTALPRSSIIISDEPLSEETNYRTEFVVVLSDQPQGGFITRKVGEDEDDEEGGSTQWEGNSMFDPLNDY